MQGILLAAGFGRRFQADSSGEQDKLLAVLPNQQTMLVQSAMALKEALPHSVAVVQPQQIVRKQILQDIGYTVIESEQAKDGMAYAIASAVRATHQASGWLIVLADMPWIPVTLIQQLAALTTRPQSVVAPRFNGKRGQPVAFGAGWYHQLVNLQGDAGARDLLTAATITWLDWHDDRIHRDVDTPQDMR